MTFIYQYCSHSIESNIYLPELPHSDIFFQFLIFQLGKALHQESTYPYTNHWSTPGGEVVLLHRKEAKTHFLRFPGSADFVLSPDTSQIECYPTPDTSDDTIRHLLLDQVLPRYLAFKGQVMLHASAVLLEAGLLLFIGATGAGKSTLAAAFHQAGYPALADDCAWLKEDPLGLRAVPCYPGLRLWEDSLLELFNGKEKTQPVAHYSTKRRIALASPSPALYQHGAPVLAMISLAPPDEIAPAAAGLRPISAREAFIEIAKQTFLLDLDDREHVTAILQALGRIVPGIPVYRLSAPRDYALLPAVRDLIIQKVRP